MPSLTEDFCAVLLRAARGPLPPPVERAARRTLLNVLGTAVSAAGSAAVGVLLAVADEAGSAGDVTVPGLTRTLDPYWGALATGTAAHLDDFDDTHLATVIHPGASTLATVLSLAPEAAPAGGAFLGAFAAGCEAQLRIGCAISPAHYDHGWHITGTCGVFGAAVAASALLGLDAEATARALSLAATMTAGHREAFGTMTKPLHAGKAAANGVLAARLAAAGLSGPADPLGDGGVLEVLAASVDREALGLGWPEGHRWELELNTIKTYPCGVVAHPAMDAAVIAHARLAELPVQTEITGITLRCNPLVPELMGREQPADGLESRFSARHGVAVCLLYGRGGLAEFSDAVATAPEVARLRSLITLDADPAVPRDAADLLVARGPAAEPRPGAAGGPAIEEPAIEVAVEHTRGSAALPLTDDEVRAKVRALFGPVLGEAAADRARDAIDKLPGAEGTSELLAALRPAAAPGKPPPVPSGPPSPATVLRPARPAPEGRQGIMTSTGEILALAASLLPATAASAGTEAIAAAAEVTEADLAAFGEAAALGAGSDVVRALRAIRPGPSSAAPPAAPPGGPAWTAWITAAAATAGGSSGSPESAATWPVHPAWIAVFAAGTALPGGPRADPAGVTVRSAIAAGMSAAAIVESGLADWGGWSPGTVAGAVGASVTAGLLLRLTEAQLRAAVGISATQASGLAVAGGTPALALQVGKAAFNGVEAALLARAGLTAPGEPLDGRRGLFALFG
jgi:2-methylcitrate dehydratase PrpD